MNYLAHFHLGNGDDGLLVGALLGDFVKGPLPNAYPEHWQQGIRLHRQIDAFTDSHPSMRECQQLFHPRYRRYAGIMLDVVFDHFLNRHWQSFHHQPLPAFSAEVFGLLTAVADDLPDAARQQAQSLDRYDVLVNYQHWKTVAAALGRISQRIRRENPLANAAEELQLHYEEIEERFLVFYPLLQRHVEVQREVLTVR